MSEFLETLAKRVLVCDGAMGTVLYEKGISFDHCFDEINLSHPEMVRAIHEAYIDAGADIIETNTFGGNRFRLMHHGLEEKIQAVNAAGVRIAVTTAKYKTEALGRRIFVAGSIGPLGKPLEPIGKITHAEARAYFAEQAKILADNGADLLMIETIGDLEEAREAVTGARSVTGLPIVAQMTFNDEAKTLMGNKPSEVARVLKEAGANVVGANCSVGPQALLEVLEKINIVPDIGFSVQPNAGLPRLVGGRYIYLASPDYFSDYAKLYMQAGANIIGGCCGTTPEHIRQIKKAIGDQPPKKIEKKTVVIETEESSKAEQPTSHLRSSLIDKFRDKKFVISVELDPPRGLNYDKVIEGAVMCRRHNVDAINIADNPLAKAGMTPLAMAGLIKQSVQIETILHFSCRDRNLIAMQSELMSAHVMHIRTILGITGDPPLVGDYPNATGVFDVDSIGLINLIRNLNNGIDLAGKSIGSRTNFFKSCAVNPTAVDMAREYDRYDQKIASGADFAMTQVLYDLKPLEDFAEKYKGKIPVLLGIMPLKNAKHANFMHHEIPDITIPENIRERMTKAGDRGQEEGVLIAKEFLREAKSMVDGVYIMPPFNKFEMAFDVLEVL
ncbi:bifunctional homocysteine S-methyltransferase/methylenetetrahydrofolate reductase [bacterium]|nr:bifunctional homocysteine S-methyltransferase/methylenetetrahydrofolate reductase [bacterium]NUN45645.1 bifunctional homocysteine S-methyltransferase/methylenetetrahydrofolate reductase [bacterium]